MPKRINKLTPEQEAMLPVWRDKWIEIGLRTGETDWATFEKYIQIAYQKAGLKFPAGKIIRVNSPIAGAFASSISDRILNHRTTGVVEGVVEGAVRSAVEGAVGDAVGGVVEGAVEGVVGGAVEGAVRSAVEGVVGGAVGDAVKGAELLWHYWLGGQFWVGWWWGSPSYVSFFTDVCGLELEKDIAERAEAYRKICESVNYIWPNKDFVIVCARPTKIERNQNGQLHSERGKAVEYPDGWGLYALSGVRFNEGLWRNITTKTISAIDAVKLENAEQRIIAVKYLGGERLMRELEGTIVAKDEYGELIEFEALKEKFPLHRMFKGFDPSKNENVWLWAQNEHQTPKEFEAWSYDLPEKVEYSPTIRT